MKKTTSRSYGLIIPKDWGNVDLILERAKEISKYYYIILHNSDCDENGELKKEHFHILMTFGAPLQLNTVFNKFNDLEKLQTNSFEIIRNIHGSKRYLVHIDNPEKFQYNADLVSTNDPLFKDCLITKKSNDAEVDEILTAFEKRELAKTEREYIDGFRPAFLSMNSYQRLMSIIALKRDYKHN